MRPSAVFSAMAGRIGLKFSPHVRSMPAFNEKQFFFKNLDRFQNGGPLSLSEAHSMDFGLILAVFGEYFQNRLENEAGLGLK